MTDQIGYAPAEKKHTKTPKTASTPPSHCPAKRRAKIMRPATICSVPTTIAIQPHVSSVDQTSPSSWNADLLDSATMPQMRCMPPATAR
jgi:hypothetical protein